MHTIIFVFEKKNSEIEKEIIIFSNFENTFLKINSLMCTINRIHIHYEVKGFQCMILLMTHIKLSISKNIFLKIEKILTTFSILKKILSKIDCLMWVQKHTDPFYVCMGKKRKNENKVSRTNTEIERERNNKQVVRVSGNGIVETRVVVRKPG